jgi:hypothetical protein
VLAGPGGVSVLQGVYSEGAERVVEGGCFGQSVGHQVGVDAQGDARVGVAGCLSVQAAVTSGRAAG